MSDRIQAISMIAALHHSDKLQRPALIVCPATVMQQWVSEFHTWWPPVRVSILHKTGSGMTVRKSKNSVYDAADDDRAIAGSGVKDQKGARGIVDRVLRQGHVLVTSYQGLESFGELLRDVQWGYVVLDEGHKIKNPAAKVTQYCKQLQSRHRILMSGTPMQNNLTEFWSLFDFVAPMMLGSLVAFKENFEQPIKDGSLKNASNLEILHANTAAKFLKETISKHFLQRLKADVASDLPPKVEQTVVVRLIKQQAEDVQKLLKSELIESCVAKRTEALVGIDQYKKLCNHPHLLLEDFYKARLGNKYGDYKLSGKMIIARQLVYRWKRDGNKMLIFCQTKQMLDIIEKMLKDCRDICYLRMDGDTKIQDRNALVDDFNGNSGINVFLLTTKVGGQGLNLISANGVIIYDPDWNPSVDIQARERIYRIGQTKPVYIFRLIAKGTIEEKILQRQIFKKVMSEKVLSDATLKSDYSHSQLKDLFTYNNDDSVLEGVGNEKKGAGYRIIGKADGETRFFDGRIEAGTGLDQVGAAQLKYARTVQEASTKKRETADIASDPSKPAATDSAIGPSAKSLGDPLADAERQKAEFRDIGASIAKSAGVDYVDVDDEDAAGTPKEADPLDRLFKNSGVFSVLSQGTNMGKDEKDMSRGDKIYTKNVAKKLQEEMRRNEETNRETKAGQVSWTGQVGTVGAPVEKPKWLLGRNASGLTRNARNGTSGPSAKRSREPTPAAAPPPSPLEVKKEELKKKIVDFMKRQTGLAVPRMMLDQQFSPQLKLGEDRSLFMSALRDVAESVSSRNEISSRWALKARYRV